MIRIVLPWPPSANRYWRHPTRGPLAGRHLISAEGRQFRKMVQGVVLEQLHCRPMLSCPLKVTFEIAPPDRRIRDISNLLKATEDALTHAGVWLDDSQIDHGEQIRRLPHPGGVLVAWIDVAAPLQAINLEPLQEAA